MSRVARVLFIDESNPPQGRGAPVADMEVLGVDVWTSSGKSWQHDGLASRIAQEEESLPMIQARNQDDHELVNSTYTPTGARR